MAVTLIISLAITALLLKSSLVTLIHFQKYGLYQFEYTKVLFDFIIALTLIFLTLYYRNSIDKDGIKGFKILGPKYCIEWENIANIYIKKILFIKVLIIEGTNNKTHIESFGTFEQFKTCVEKFDKDGKLSNYLNTLTSEQIKSINTNYRTIFLTGIVAFIILLSTSAYTNFIWYPEIMLQAVQKNIEIKKAELPRQLGEGILLENIVLFPEQKRSEYTYMLATQCDENFFDTNIRNVLENLVKTDFCPKAINYLNYGFSEVHKFNYLGFNEKPLVSQIIVDKAFCNN